MIHNQVRNRGIILVGMLLTLSFAAGSAQTPSAQSSPGTIPEILNRMAQNTKGLTSYAVPFHIDAHFKKSFISVHVPLDGTRYFERPDKSTVKISNPPPQAKELASIYSWLGTPETWPSTYDIALVPAKSSGIYELRATYKPNSRTHELLDKAAQSTVDYVLLDVDAQTFDPVRASWFYHNGSKIVMNIKTGAVGKYRLPQSENVDMRLPGHSATAQVTYGTYQTNVSIPDSTFSGSGG